MKPSTQDLNKSSKKKVSETQSNKAESDIIIQLSVGLLTILFIVLNPYLLLWLLTGFLLYDFIIYSISSNRFSNRPSSYIALIFVLILLAISSLHLEKLFLKLDYLNFLDSFSFTIDIKYVQISNIIAFLIGIVGSSVLDYRSKKYIVQRRLFIWNIAFIFSYIDNFFISVPKNNNLILGKKTSSGDVIDLSSENLTRHIQILGGSGSGKSNLLKNLFEHHFKKNRPFIFVDLKGEKDMLNWLKNCANATNNIDNLRIISSSKGSSNISYNPIRGASPSEIVSRIMNFFDWSNEFYESQSALALLLVSKYLDKITPDWKSFYDLHDVYNLLTSQDFFRKLEQEYNVFGSDPEEMKVHIKHLYSHQGVQNISGLTTKLQLILGSNIGKILIDDQDYTNTLGTNIKTNKFTYIQANSMKDKLSAEFLNRLVLLDMIATVGREYDEVNSKNSLVGSYIIDEFKSAAVEQFNELLDRSRSVGLGITISHQSPSDLEGIAAGFAKGIDVNTATKIIFGTDQQDDVELHSNRLGTKSTSKITSQFNQNTMTDSGSEREVEEFVIHPNEIKRLRVGEALVIKRQVNIDYGIIKIDLATDYLKTENSDKEIKNFSGIKFRDFNSSEESITKVKELPKGQNSILSEYDF